MADFSRTGQLRQPPFPRRTWRNILLSPPTAPSLTDKPKRAPFVGPTSLLPYPCEVTGPLDFSLLGPNSFLVFGPRHVTFRIFLSTVRRRIFHAGIHVASELVSPTNSSSCSFTSPYSSSLDCSENLKYFDFFRSDGDKL